MNVEEYLKSGEAYCNQNDFDRAIAEFTEALRLDPNLAVAKRNLRVAYFNSGIKSFQNGDNDSAIKAITEAIALNPNDAYAYEVRGMVYGEKKNHDKAIDDWKKVIELAPSIKAHFFLARCYIDQRKEWRTPGNGVDYSKYRASLDRSIENFLAGFKLVPANDDETAMQTDMRNWLESTKNERENRDKVYKGMEELSGLLS